MVIQNEELHGVPLHLEHKDERSDVNPSRPFELMAERLVHLGVLQDLFHLLPKALEQRPVPLLDLSQGLLQVRRDDRAVGHRASEGVEVRAELPARAEGSSLPFPEVLPRSPDPPDELGSKLLVDVLVEDPDTLAEELVFLGGDCDDLGHA